MPSHDFILLLALTVALATWGFAQLALSWFHRDKHKIQERLASDWHSDVDALLNRSITVQETDALPRWMTRSRLLLRLNQQLLQAYPDASVPRFLGICASSGLCFFTCTALALNWALAGLAAGCVGASIPILLIRHMRARRQRLLADHLPEALDFLTRILRAGHSLSTGIQMMGDELPAPLGAEFRRCYDRHSLGVSLEQALREMTLRIDSTDFAFFVTAVLIQRQTGGDLSEVLSNISNMVRARLRLQQHVKAITAEGRLTGYILIAFPAVLFAISYSLNPEYAGVLVTTDIGRLLMVIAAAMEAIGFFAIRKIVAVKV